LTLRTLVVTRTAGFRHESIPAAVAALAARPELEVRHTEDPADVTRCADHDVVAFVSTSGDILDEAARNALRQWVLAGGGFAGVHCAAATEDGWSWYGELLGARFAGHPPQVQDGVVVVQDAAHPSTAHLPARWPFRDEWYSFTDVRDDLHLLLSVDAGSIDAGDFAMPEPHPQAWWREVGSGRSFFTALGHTDEAWADPAFLEHVVAGVHWAGRG
jgi:type 1 glutamine amidotransferase